jgi:hypothetical protein
MDSPTTITVLRGVDRRLWVFGLCLLAVGGLSLARTWQYYGRLLSGWDAQFYYAQARSLVFDADLDVTNDLQSTPYRAPFDHDGDGLLERVRRDGQGRIISKHPIGLSLMQIPWIGLGYGLRRSWETFASVRFTEPPGYSALEVNTVAVGMLVYTVAGLILLALLMREHVGVAGAELVTTATWLGSSLFYYSAVDPFMTHGVGFTLVVASLYQAQALGRENDHKLPAAMLGLALTCGVLFLVRPQQVLLVPLLTPWIWAYLRSAPGAWLRALAAAVVLLTAIFLLSWHNYLQQGVLTLNAYALENQHFKFLNPRLAIFLLGLEQGLLRISPIVIVASIGYAYRFVQDRQQDWLFWALLLHGAVQAYVIASWSPIQGQSFGARMWCESTPFVAFGLALLLRISSRPVRSVATVAIGLSVMWTMYRLLNYVRWGVGLIQQ